MLLLNKKQFLAFGCYPEHFLTNSLFVLETVAISSLKIYKQKIRIVQAHFLRKELVRSAEGKTKVTAGREIVSGL